MNAAVIPLRIPGRPRVLLASDAAEHQPKLFLLPGTDQIAVSCSCRCRPGGSYAPLECRVLWDTPAVLQVHREHRAAEMLASARRDKARDINEERAT